MTIYPQGIESKADYTFENPETGEEMVLSGDDLMHDGFAFALPPRSGALWLYRKH